jgi:hypothetical protein
MNTHNLSKTPIEQPISSNPQLVEVPLTPNTPIAVQAIIIESIELNPKMRLALTYSKIINIICILDIIFGLCYSLYYPNFLVPILFSISGYLGTKWFNKNLIIFYLFYIVFNFIFRVVNFSWLLSQSYELHTNASFVVLSIILYIFEILIIILVCRFLNLLKDLLDSEIKFLRTDFNTQKQFICNC